MPRPIAVASATGNVQALTGGATVVGVTVAAAAAAVVRVHDGTSTSDPVVAVAQLGGAGTVHVPVPATTCNTGLYVERTAAAEAVLYVM